MHHIISDGWSMGILIREVSAIYDAYSRGKPSPLPELPIQYADFAQWQRHWVQGDVLNSQLEYWKKKLGGLPHVLELPIDKPRPAMHTSRGATQSFALPLSLSDSLRELSKKGNVTLFMTLLAGFNVFLARYSGQVYIGIGLPIAGRTHSDIEALIGFFVNNLVIRTDLSGNPSFSELLSRVRETTLEAYEHQDLPFEKLVEELQPKRDPSRTPLVQVGFAFQNLPAHSLELKESGLILSPFETGSAIAKTDLALYISDVDHGLNGSLEYNTDLFDHSTITRMIENLQILLESIVRDPDIRISDLNIMTEKEKNQVLVEWNNTKGDYPRERCIQELFEVQAEKTPQNIAVLFEGKQLTYKELNERANRLANFLTEKGVKPEALVGICIERSLDMIIGVLGILKAGAAYVPLDPTHPKERLAFMIDDAKVSVILTQSRLTDRLPENVVRSSHDGIRGIIYLDIDWGTISTKRKNNPKSGVKPFNLAYVIYTSGTTGPSKGVMVEHRSIVNVVTSFVREYDLSMDDRILQQTSLSFDVSVNEIFPILSTGGAVVLPKSEEILDFEKLARLISESDVTIFGAVPSVLARFNAISQELPKVRLILSGGEALSFSDVDNLLEFTRVTNGYGPTETTVCASSYDLVSHDTATRVTIPIGKPLQNLQIYIVDQNLRCVPIGCPGELCIAGVGLARGYLNAPDLTSKKFVPNPFKPGERLYRTGDLARWLPNGIIEFLGRKDRQIKIRGFRIELGEIEATIGQHPGIQEATVLDLDYATGDRRLVAYLVPDMKRAFPIRQLLRYEQEGVIDESHMYELPNGMAICHQNKGESEFLYKEIFEYRSHIGPGIILHDGDCIFDVGANIGLFTLFVSQLCHKPIIYAFEPIPPIFEKLTINTALYGLNVKLFQCGLADREGQAEFVFFPEAGAMSGRFADRSDMMARQIEVQEAIREYLSRTVSGLNSASPCEDLLDELLPKEIRTERYSCHLKTISEVVRENKIECIDLLKIDVEKSEFDVLAGIHEEDWSKIRQIVIETQEDHEQLERLTNLLQSHGYDLEIQQNSFFRDSKIVITNLYALRKDQNRASSKKYSTRKNVGKETTWSSPTRLLSDVQKFLKDRLPNYMVPAHFVMLDSIPLSPNGKVDREALPRPDSLKSRLEESYVPPRSLTEKKLTDIWSEVIGVEKVGVFDNFFELGGHSLLATQVVSRARDAF
ncbi:MAG: amino acid adenylation domain-containing protein, partial [Thermodesulfobacteriota bacterium]